MVTNINVISWLRKYSLLKNYKIDVFFFTSAARQYRARADFPQFRLHHLHRIPAR